MHVASDSTAAEAKAPSAEVRATRKPSRARGSRPLPSPAAASRGGGGGGGGALPSSLSSLLPPLAASRPPSPSFLLLSLSHGGASPRRTARASTPLALASGAAWKRICAVWRAARAAREAAGGGGG